ncbi:CaiB/BaiF CoA transferase family protein [Sabulicella glaciei]|uniref:CoA transferase n=1 Tax=Sabulicella glaciei TaxID=2984948 RepID=A0ABT3NTG2_9PROT|nr:CoA transferase [Roseococcus sp. MDT2-1-1]MCW8085445.1 CoA transferase [Roseococcus sp. MDT2-1-1]
MAGPLAGIRVLDLTTTLMGPYATQTLAEMGAEVVKVEPPEGDIVRRIGPARNPGMGPIFLNTNRGKRSLVLDLKNPEGREAALRLAARSDVLVYSLRPHSMERLGLGYETVAQVNPRLVYAGVYGYAQDGPYAARPAYDDLLQGATGVAALNARIGDGTPRYVPLGLVDRIVGLAASGAISAALLHREHTGMGQRVDVPMFETMLPFVLGDHMGGLAFDPPLDAGGYARMLSPGRRPYRTRDGWICAVVYTDKHWRSFCAGLGMADLVSIDKRFADHGARIAHINEILAMVSEIMAQRDTAEWMEFFEKADIPAMPVNDLADLLDDPHLRETGFFEMEEHPTEGRLRRAGIGPRWSASPAGERRPAPVLGADGAEVLREAGYEESEIRRLAELGATRLPGTGE